MFKFVPIIKHLVWGSETWLISSVPGSESVVADGPCKGKTIGEIYGGEFPLLIKFIDADTDLSIQVHPDDRLARERHGCNGKTEMWYVRKADKGACLLSGLTKEITKDEYVRRVGDNTITDVLGRHEIRKGDVFFLPAGRIHAIGGGCHIAEIQQTSNITYRIYDYGRPGLDGKPRQLHTEEAKDAIDYKVYPSYMTQYEHSQNKEVVLVSCDHFVTSLYDTTRETIRDLSDLNAYLVVICLEGKGSVNGEKISEGDVFLLSDKEKELRIKPEGNLRLLTSHVPSSSR